MNKSYFPSMDNITTEFKLSVCKKLYSHGYSIDLIRDEIDIDYIKLKCAIKKERWKFGKEKNDLTSTHSKVVKLATDFDDGKRVESVVAVLYEKPCKYGRLIGYGSGKC